MQKGARGSILFQKATRVLSSMRGTRGSMADISSRSESLAPGAFPARTSTAAIDKMPPGLDANVLRLWLVRVLPGMHFLFWIIYPTRNFSHDPISLRPNGSMVNVCSCSESQSPMALAGQSVCVLLGRAMYMHAG